MTAIYESEMREAEAREAAEQAAQRVTSLNVYRSILRTPSKPGDGSRMRNAMKTAGITQAQHDEDKAAVRRLASLEADIVTDTQLADAEAEMRRVVDSVETEWRALLCEMVNRLPGILSEEAAPIQGLFFKRDFGQRLQNFRPWESFDALKNVHMLLGERVPQDDRENWSSADYDVIDRLDSQRRAAVSRFNSLKFQSERANADAHALRTGNPRVFGDAS